jgi:hypothetical protein
VVRNLEFLAGRIAAVEALIASPPVECTSPTDPNKPNDPEGAQDPMTADGESPSPDSEDASPGGGSNGRDPQAGVNGPTAQEPRRGLGEDEKEQVAAAFARIREEQLEDGKFYRRTRAEQFPAESWRNPDPVLWW